MHVSSSYAKILGEKLFRTWEFPRSGSKAKNGEKKRKKRGKDRKLVITMAKLRMAHASTHGARKPPGPKCMNACSRGGVQMSSSQANSDRQTLGHTEPGVSREAPPLKIYIKLSGG